MTTKLVIVVLSGSDSQLGSRHGRLKSRDRLRAHRANYSWRVLPGSKKRYDRFHSDGYIPRINALNHD